jgi:uncharacterized protein
MASLLQRPILLGGLSLTFGVWLLDQFVPIVPDETGTALWAAIALGSGIWFLKQQRSQAARKAVWKPSLIDRARVLQAIAATEVRINQFISEVATEVATAADSAGSPILSESAFAQVNQFRQQLAAIQTGLERSAVDVALLGRREVGKSTVGKFLDAIATESGDEFAVSEKGAVDATYGAGRDIGLFVVSGDLTDGEFTAIQSLVKSHHRLVVAVNKLDHVLPNDRPVVLQQVRDRLAGLLEPEDIVAVTANPTPYKVRQHQADGTVVERMEQPAPEMADLQTRIKAVTTEHQTLVITTAFRQVEGLKAQIQTELNRVRRDRAQPMIEQYQWIAATAAFANPVPSLDVLATATINAQLIVDLGQVYQRHFSLDQAKTMTLTLGSQMVKLGLVEMASSAIAPLLKSTALTYVAGGLMQGLSAAYLTQLAGLTMVDYFENTSQTESGWSLQGDRLVETLRKVFQENQRVEFVQNLVKQGVAKLIPGTAVQTI